MVHPTEAGGNLAQILRPQDMFADHGWGTVVICVFPGLTQPRMFRPRSNVLPVRKKIGRSSGLMVVFRVFTVLLVGLSVPRASGAKKVLVPRVPLNRIKAFQFST